MFIKRSLYTYTMSTHEIVHLSIYHILISIFVLIFFNFFLVEVFRAWKYHQKMCAFIHFLHARLRSWMSHLSFLYISSYNLNLIHGLAKRDVIHIFSTCFCFSQFFFVAFVALHCALTNGNQIFIFWPLSL